MSRRVYFHVPDSDQELSDILRELMLLPTANSDEHGDPNLSIVPSEFIARFNEAVELILVDDQIKRFIRMATAQFSVIPFFRNLVSYMVSHLSLSNPLFTYDLFQEAFITLTSNHRLEFIRGIIV